jgi:hypothetical protein
MAETRKDLGEIDASFIDTFSNVIEKAADASSHKLHPMVESTPRYSRMGRARRC